MPDGGIIDEDFPHIANTIAELMKTKKIPPIILVGIANTQRRRDLTGPTEVAKDKEIAPIVGGSEKFRAFILEEYKNGENIIYHPRLERHIVIKNGLLAIGESGRYMTKEDAKVMWSFIYQRKDLLIAKPFDYFKKGEN